MNTEGLNHSNLLVMQVSTFGRMTTRGLLDRAGIAKEGINYSFCRTPEMVDLLLVPGERQLILTSHIGGACDCFVLAERWRTSNPEAMVVALTASSIVNPEGSPVEGVISKRMYADMAILAVTIDLFRKGATRIQLREVLDQEIS